MVKLLSVPSMMADREGWGSQGPTYLQLRKNRVTGWIVSCVQMRFADVLVVVETSKEGVSGTSSV